MIFHFSMSVSFPADTRILCTGVNYSRKYIKLNGYTKNYGTMATTRHISTPSTPPPQVWGIHCLSHRHMRLWGCHSHLGRIFAFPWKQWYFTANKWHFWGTILKWSAHQLKEVLCVYSTSKSCMKILLLEQKILHNYNMVKILCPFQMFMFEDGYCREP